MDTDVGPFTLTTAIAPVPAGDTCGTATAIAGTMSLPMQSLDGFADDYSSGPGCAPGSAGTDRAYKVSLPAGSRLTATVTDDMPTDGGASASTTLDLVVGSCMSVLTCANSATDGFSQTAILDNSGAAAQDVFIVVDSLQGASAGTWTLDVTVTSMTFAPGEVCENAAAAITATTTLTAQSFASYVSNYSYGDSSCDYTPGPDRAYTVDIPAGDVLRVAAAGEGVDGGPAFSLNLVDDSQACGSGTCLSSTSIIPVGATVSNSSGTGVRRVHVVIDAFDQAPTDTFSLAVTLGPPPPGDTCGMPTVISASGTLAGETTAGFTNDYSPTDTSTNCTGYTEDGPDHVYSIVVPMGKTLSLTVAPTGPNMANEDPAVYLIGAPASNCVPVPMMCLAGSDMGFDGQSEMTTYTNSGAMDQTVFIIVDSFRNESMEYSLTTAIQ
jgi:hypothetical protein